jgi:hypothetical protein
MNTVEFGLPLDSLEREQKAHEGQYMGRLVHDSIQRYIRAAALLQMDSVVLENMRDFVRNEFYISPLSPLYQVICDRYNKEVFNPQTDFWSDPEVNMLAGWRRYYLKVIVPEFTGHHESIRNVLSVMDLLPCRSKEWALEALLIRVRDLALPEINPPWATEGMQGLFYENVDPNPDW